MGDWNGDGADEVGVYAAGFWFLDLDGNGVWDGGLQDRLFAFGWAGATPVIGDWNGDGTTDVGVFANGYWFLDADGNRVWDGGVNDLSFPFGWLGVKPLVGDWDGDGRDQVGVFNQGIWLLDYDGNALWDGGNVDRIFGWGWDGVQVVIGDWNGDGRDKAGVYNNGSWFLDTNGDAFWDGGVQDQVISLGWPQAVPVVGDWNGDGRDKIGVYSGGNWFLDQNGNGLWETGQDAVRPFGATGEPVVGRWTAPTTDLSIYPSDGARDVPTAARVILTLTAPVDAASVTAASVQVRRAGAPVAAALVVSPDGRFISVRPGALQQDSAYDIVVNGLRSRGGQAVPSAHATFQTGATADVRFELVRSATKDLPTTGSLYVGLSDRADPATMSAASFYLEDGLTRQTYPISCSLEPDWLSIKCVHPQAFPVKSALTLRAVGFESIHGRTANFYWRFETGFEPDNDQAPRILDIFPPDGSTNVPSVTSLPNGIEWGVRFDEPVAVDWPPPDISVTRDGAPVDFLVFQFSDALDELLIRPVQGSSWAPSANYTITVRKAFDLSGQPTASGATATFTTAPADTSNLPVPVFRSSGAGSRIPLNSRFFFNVDGPSWNQASVGTDRVQLQGPHGSVPLELLWETPGRFWMTPTSLLEPNAAYSLSFGPFFAQNGKRYESGFSFTTGATTDMLPPRVTGVLPPDGSQGIPTNQPIQLEFSETISPLSQSPVRVERADGELIPGTFSTYLDGPTIYLGTLLPNEQYRFTVDSFVDRAGNLVEPFQATFTTGSSTKPTDNTPPTLQSAIPANRSSGVSLTPTLHLEFSEPIDPRTFDTFYLRTSGIYTPFDLTPLDNGRILEFRPRVPLEPGRAYSLVSYGLQDWSGNRATFLAYYFTTVAGAIDNTPPTILSITPPDGSILSGSGHQLEITFSEPIEETTLTNQLFLLSDGELLWKSLRSLGDGRRYTLDLPGESGAVDRVVDIIIGPNVQDLYGNPLGQRRTHRIVIQAAPQSGLDDWQQTSYSAVKDVRPVAGSTGIQSDATVTLIADAPILPQSLDGNLLVSENGVLIEGAIVTRGHGQIAEFRPASPFQPGALVRVFLRNLLQAPDGGTFGLRESEYFTVAGGDEPFELLGFFPDNATVGKTARPRVYFSKPLLPASLSSITISDFTGSGAAIATAHLVEGGRAVEVRPIGEFQPDGLYSVSVPTTVRSASGELLSSARYFYFQADGSVDTTPPAAISMSPFAGSVNVPLNAHIRVAYPASDVDPWSIRKESLRLEALGHNWPIGKVTHESGQTFDFVPLEALQEGAVYTATLSGARDSSGNVAQPLTWTFQAGSRPDFRPPESRYRPYSGLAPDSTIVIPTNEPLDPTTLPSAVVWPSSRSERVAGEFTLSSDGTAILFTPDQPFQVGTSYDIYSLTIQDQAGNSYHGDRSFSVGFEPDLTGPTVTQTSVPEGAQNVSLFARIEFTLSETPDPQSVGASTVRLLRGGTELPVSADVESGASKITVGCKCALEPGASYTIEIHGVRDFAGNSIFPAFVLHFTTRPVYDFSAPTFSYNIGGFNGMFRNVVAKVRASELLNPATVNPNTIYYRVDYEPWPSAVTWDATEKIIRISPLQPLPAGSSVEVVVTSGVEDLYGNYGYQSTATFSTGSALDDVDPPVITAVNPPDGAMNVSVDTPIWVQFSENFDPFSGGQPGYRLLGPGGIETSISNGLLPDTAYTISVPAEGTDFADLPFAGAQFTFTTGNASTTDTTPPRELSFSPAPDAVDVPLDAVLEVVFNEPVVMTTTFSRWTGWVWSPVELIRLPTVDQTRALLQPTEPLRPDSRYRFYYSARDLAGNYSAGSSRPYEFHTTPDSPDDVPPRVLSVNPPDNATGVVISEIMLELSEPIQSATVRQGVEVFQDGATRSFSYSYAEGGTTLYLRPSLPTTSIVTVAVSPGLLDYAGNPAEPFVSRYEPAPVSSVARGIISAVRPTGGSVGVSSAFTFSVYLSQPIDPSTAAAAVRASEDGVLIGGSVAVSANHQILLFTPDRPYAAGSSVRLFIDQATLRRESGEPFGSYMWASQCKVKDAEFRLVSGSPLTPRPRNTELTFRFSAPLDPASVGADSVQLREQNPAPLTWTVSADGLELRVKPVQSLAPQTSYQVYLGALRSLDGQELEPQLNFYFSTTDELATLAPAGRVSPSDGLGEVGVNALVLAIFDGPIEPATVNEQTVYLMRGSEIIRPSAIEVSNSYAKSRRTFVITPEAPLAPSSDYQVVLDGVRDLAGNPSPPASATFRTGTGADLTGPQLLAFSPQGVSAPRNTTIVLRFDEPINPLTAEPSALIPYVASPSFSALQDPDGRTVYLVPDAPLDANSTVSVWLEGRIRDMSGNLVRSYNSHVGISITDEIDTTPPTLTFSQPADGATNIPINAGIVLGFDSPLESSSLTDTNFRIEKNGASIPIRVRVLNGGQTVLLTPAALFDPLTTYSWTVEKMVDLAGNTGISGWSGSFTTGSAAVHTAPTLVDSTPTTGAVGIDRDTPWILTFDAPINPASLSVRPNPSVPTETEVSRDGKVVTIRPESLWPAQTDLQLVVDYEGLTNASSQITVTATTGP